MKQSRSTSAPGQDSGDLDPSRWTSTFVEHSRSRLVHTIRFYLYERVFFRHVTDTDASILDVGCGSGEFIQLLQQRGYRNLRGVEIDDALITMSPETMPVITKASATSLPFADNSFDCVYMFNVMHHLTTMDDYRLTLEEMTRCVRDGGVLILVEPCRLPLYWLLKTTCRVFSPFSSFCRNFHVILEEEWENLSYFLRHLKQLRKLIAESGHYSLIKDDTSLHQWFTVLTVLKGSNHHDRAGSEALDTPA